MTFVEFLRELKKKLNGSESSYRMTKKSVEFFLKSRQVYEIDKKIIFDAIRNDTLRQNNEQSDPLSLCAWWNNQNLNFELKF
jgi:hypothetical protein